jgi:ribosome-associated heat shock protein Hsp15
VAEDVRLDVWLDIACLARTRSQAKELCDGGKVEVNGQPATSHRVLRLGDRVRVNLGPALRREVKVLALADRHVARAQARTLYEDLTPPPTEEELEMRRMSRLAPPPAPPRGLGRPEKRDRRKIERFRGR